MLFLSVSKVSTVALPLLLLRLLLALSFKQYGPHGVDGAITTVYSRRILVPANDWVQTAQKEVGANTLSKWRKRAIAAMQI